MRGHPAKSVPFEKNKFKKCAFLLPFFAIGVSTGVRFPKITFRILYGAISPTRAKKV
jgi:hypothetical protein